jgi:hypothetical protein
VPLVESFYKRVPVLAYAATAVPATMDGGGVLYETQDPFDVARLMEAVLDDPRIEQAVLDSQDAALARLRARDFDRTLLRAIEPLLAAGPLSPPEVAWDFWSQFDQVERLEELRLFRPAVFRALPDRPAPNVTRDPATGVRNAVAPPDTSAAEAGRAVLENAAPAGSRTS